MLSALARTFYAESPLLAYPIIALVLFLAAFVAVTWKVARSSRAELDAMAQLPFHDEPTIIERDDTAAANEEIDNG
jgi:hypothetical protein